MKVSIYVHVKQGLLLSALAVYFYRAIFFGNFVKVQIFIFIFFILLLFCFGTGTVCLLSTNYYFYDSVINILKKNETSDIRSNSIDYS